MFETRRAEEADAPLITRHRKAMFADAGNGPESVLEDMARSFEPWLRQMMAEDKYIGWITCAGERQIASSGLLVLDWAPHFLDPLGRQRGYVLNVYVEPEFRRRGLAQALVTECLDEARRKGIRVVALHATDAGRGVYEKLGFHSTNEMIYVERNDSGTSSR